MPSFYTLAEGTESCVISRFIFAEHNQVVLSRGMIPASSFATEVVVVLFCCKTHSSLRHWLTFQESAFPRGKNNPILQCQIKHFTNGMQGCSRQGCWVCWFSSLQVPCLTHSSAYGEFEVTHECTDITSASFLNTVGKKTRCLVRISTVGPERGSADTIRDVHGWAMKLYTDEGNLDWVFNNTASCGTLPVLVERY